MPKNKTMRITGGTLVRRRFLLPAMVDEGSVRPTPDLVREAIFSMLIHDIAGAKVLDLFAGSGAHGFEVISRGAKSVLFVERDPRVASVIRRNIDTLGLKDVCDVKIGDSVQFISTPPKEIMDMIFVDPPYALKPDKEFFKSLLAHLAEDGVVIFRCHKKDFPAIDESFEIFRDRIYGSTRVFILRRALTQSSSS